MTTQLKRFALAIAGTLIASSCWANEASQKEYEFSEERMKRIQKQQDRVNRRRQAEALRAQRSICEDRCVVTGRPRRTQPADPFTELPSWETLYDPPQLSAEDE